MTLLNKLKNRGQTMLTKSPPALIDQKLLASVFSKLFRIGCETSACGSRVTCSPPPADTDADYLVVIPQFNRDAVSRVVSTLEENGFKWEGSEHYQDMAQGGFMSWRSCEVNLIVTANRNFADRHLAATSVCTRLNLLAKGDRIAVFQAVLYGNVWPISGGAP